MYCYSVRATFSNNSLQMGAHFSFSHILEFCLEWVLNVCEYLIMHWPARAWWRAAVLCNICTAVFLLQVQCAPLWGRHTHLIQASWIICLSWNLKLCVENRVSVKLAGVTLCHPFWTWISYFSFLLVELLLFGSSNVFSYFLTSQGYKNKVKAWYHRKKH